MDILGDHPRYFQSNYVLTFSYNSMHIIIYPIIYRFEVAILNRN